MKFRNYISIISLFLFLFCYGCAAFRAGNLSPVAQWPPPSITKKKSISIVIGAEAAVYSEIISDDLDVFPSTLYPLRKQTIKAYKNSGLFSEVKTGFYDTELRAEVKITSNFELNIFLTAFSLATLTIIPNNYTYEYIIKTTITDREGNIIDIIEKSESINEWQQLLLIFLSPFFHPYIVVENTLYDLNFAVINSAYEKGIF